jgi:hypothetical protein
MARQPGRPGRHRARGTMTGQDPFATLAAPLSPAQRAEIAEALEHDVAAARETLAVHAKLAQDVEWRSRHDPRALAKLDRVIARSIERLRAVGLAEALPSPDEPV